MAELDLEEIKKKKFNISVENLITLGAVVVTIVGMWYSLQADIELAKELPEPEVSRTVVFLLLLQGVIDETCCLNLAHNSHHLLEFLTFIPFGICYFLEVLPN